MTTPADNTPRAILYDAYVDAGKLQEGDELGGEQLAAGMRRLRDLVNFWQTQGLKLWLLSDTAVTIAEFRPDQFHIVDGSARQPVSNAHCPALTLK